MAKLVVIAKGAPGKAHELNGHWTTIGRGDGNTFQLIEPSISGRHCEVQLKGEELVVRDLLSTNGSFIGGEKITEGVLKPGHTLRIGDVELRFENSRPATPGTSFISKMLLKKSSAHVEATPPKPAPVENSPLMNRVESENDQAKKSHALFVDDSMAFLETFTELCSALANNTWKISCATSADCALAILQEGPVDLVVLDIGIPMVDGIQLMGIVRRRYPGMKIAVLTGSPSESNRAACLSGNADLFIEKPVSPEGVKVVFNMLKDLMSWTAREGFSGSLHEVGLQDLIQMECIGRRSTIFEIRDREISGEIFIEGGAVIHASVGVSVGEPAFNQLLSLKGGEFQMRAFMAPEQRTIKQGWEVLLMEAARASDEETAFLKKPLDQRTSAPEETVPDDAGDEFVVVATYEGEWTAVDEGKK